MQAEQQVLVNEVFLSIQGEGTRAGRPCTLIRLAGCDLRCTWCDTRYAYDEGDRMPIRAVLEKVASLGCRLVEVTGGEPLIQSGTLELLTALYEAGHEVLLETSGAHDIAAVDPRVIRIVDVKCPSSGQTERIAWRNLHVLRPTDEVKFVLADRADYDFARQVISQYDLPLRCTVLIGSVAGKLDLAQLAEWVLQDRLDVRLQVQLHKVIWPGEEHR